MLEGEPELFPHLNSIWQAFITLDRSRQYGYGHPQPIQFSEMLAYANARRLKGDRMSELIEYVQELDTIYLIHHKEKSDKEHRKSRNKAKS